MSFDHILEFICSQNEFIIYAILLVSAFIENVFPPFPGDAVMLSGAYLAGKGNISYIGVLISSVGGGLIGVLTLYRLGKTGGRRFFETGKGKYLIKGNLTRTESHFKKYGSTILLISRFLPGIRSAIAISAGIVEYDFRRMIILSTVSFLLWNGMLTGLMIYSKSNWRLIIDLVKKFNIVLIVIGLIILIGWIILALWKRRKNSR
jgi:membrane protein DedA with SNARE-associated domain